MAMKKYKPGQIVTLLQQIEVEIANGKTTPQACRDAQITALTLSTRSRTRFSAASGSNLYFQSDFSQFKFTKGVWTRPKLVANMSYTVAAHRVGLGVIL
jgi:hypothetical protein